MAKQWYVRFLRIWSVSDVALGMAVRLAVDLGLHLDPQPYVNAGMIEEEEAAVRKVVWGGVFVHDRYRCPPFQKMNRIY